MFALIGIAVMVLAAVAGLAVVERASADGHERDTFNRPTVTKEFVNYSNGIAEWRITISGAEEVFPGSGSDGDYFYNFSDATALSNLAPPGTFDCLGAWAWNSSDGLTTDGCERSSTDATWVTVWTAVTPTCEPQIIENTVVATIFGAEDGENTYVGDPVVIEVTERATISDDSLCQPTIEKKFLGASGGVAEWLVTVTTPTWSDVNGDWGWYGYWYFDEGATNVKEGSNFIRPCTSGGSPEGILLQCEQDSNTTQNLIFETLYTAQCEDQVISNTVTGEAWFNGGHPYAELPNGEDGTWPLTASATGTAPGDPNLCLTVRKFFDTDESGDLDAGADTLVDGWGIEVSCNTGTAIPVSGVTGADGLGTITFSLPHDATECTVTEATDILVVPVGYLLDGESLTPGISATFTVHPGNDAEHTVDFLNDPVELTIPTPPPGGTPPPGVETSTPVPTIAPPTVAVVEPTETPDDAVSDITPIVPDSGSGLAASSGNSATAMFMAAAALIALGGAVGTFSLARKRE